MWVAAAAVDANVNVYANDAEQKEPEGEQARVS